jgi:hypothetical protein
MAKSRSSSTLPGWARSFVSHIERELERGRKVQIEISHRVGGRLKTIKTWIDRTVTDIWAHIVSLPKNGNRPTRGRVLQSAPAAT